MLEADVVWRHTGERQWAQAAARESLVRYKENSSKTVSKHWSRSSKMEIPKM